MVCGGRVRLCSSAFGRPPWFSRRTVRPYTAAGQLFFSLTPLPSGMANNYAVGWNWYDASGLQALSKNGYSNTNYPVPDTTLAGEYTAYVYDGGQPVMLLQRGNSGTWAVTSRMLVAGADRPLAGLYNGQTLAVVTDRSGTVVAGVQPSAAADQLATYVSHGPFGNVENPTGAPINTGGDVQAGFTGAGGTPNGLGLVYLRNRWYDPQTGRFLTQDPIGLAGGLNLYAYAGNNPTSFSDPFGSCSKEDGYKDCNRMVTALESATALKVAPTWRLPRSSASASGPTRPSTGRRRRWRLDRICQNAHIRGCPSRRGSRSSGSAPPGRISRAAPSRFGV